MAAPHVAPTDNTALWRGVCYFQSKVLTPNHASFETNPEGSGRGTPLLPAESVSVDSPHGHCYAVRGEK